MTNTSIIIGRAAADPERRTLGDGTAVAAFTLCYDRPKRNGVEQSPYWIPCKVFGNRAETILKYVRKGTKIAVTGTLTTDSYEMGGKTIKTFCVNVREFDILTWQNDEPDDLPFG